MFGNGDLRTAAANQFKSSTMLPEFRHAWQKLFIGVARSERLSKIFHSSSRVDELIQRYIGGPTASTGISRAADLNRARFTCSMFYLGEYLKDQSDAHNIVESILNLVQLISSTGMDAHISVDPTAIGYLQSPSFCQANAFRIAEAIETRKRDSVGFHCLMLDMEDEGLVSYTIDLHDRLSAAGLPAALTLQAYLLRTQEDLQRQIQSGSAVRLVKGAFAAKPGIACQGQAEITKQYLVLARMMLDGAISSPGFYPIFATHNEGLLEEIISLARARDLTSQSYEFEMLLGVRPELAARLSSRGFRVRIYVPCGPDWWGYVNRRIGESPRNGFLLLRAIFT
jgi:proline dehydrogenase